MNEQYWNPDVIGWSNYDTTVKMLHKGRTKEVKNRFNLEELSETTKNERKVQLL